ncbi:GTP-binding protein [Natronospora cellulosivora (SeqCode)]
MNITVGVAAHVDAGKTTFSEGLLYHTNTIREMGRVDHQNAYLDTHQIEKERGITIFAEQAVMEYKGDNYYLIDTPGHVDFSAEMERTIMVMDYAIIIVSAVEGIQCHTETVWHLLRKHGIPAFFFINKTDRVGADVDRVLDEIRANLSEDALLLNNSIEEELDEDIIEFVAERNDKLLELYLDGKYDKKLWIEEIKKMIKENNLYICSSGSALQDQGVIEFFDNFHHLTFSNYSDSKKKDLNMMKKESAHKQKEKDCAYAARVYKIGHDDNANRITHMKILDGSINVRDEITYKFGEKEVSEKVNQVRIYNGKKYQAVERAEAGQLIGVLGLSKSKVGQGLGALLGKDAIYNMVPTLKSSLVYDSTLNVKEVLAAFNILNEEDPALKLSWEEELQEIQISVMGPIQLEILKAIVKDRFDISVDFAEPGIIYKETIKGEVIGYGHFEPLKHYAEVHLKIEAGKRDSGIVFENLAHVDDLSKGNQNLVRQHIFEREHKGLLTGSPLSDLKITLLTGAAHNKHTHGGDFREATYRALWQGLEKAEKILLEPYYGFKIKVDLDDMGRVMSDIEKASGSFEAPKTFADKAIIRGRAPVATFMNYPTELLAFTAGKGMINLVFAGYDICHNSEEIIEKIAYDKDAEREYSSSSVFCAKGKGYIVPWDQAEAKMHCG